MSGHAASRRTVAPLAIVTAAALAVVLLLLLVRLQWAPLESADHAIAARLNGLVAGHPMAVRTIEAVTWLGSGGVLGTLTGAATVMLAFRRRWRLAAYLLVTGAGELVLDPVLKALVGRSRPVVAHPIAYGNLGTTAFLFELSRQVTGQPVTDPVTEGLEPEARADLQPTEPETTMQHDRARTYGRIAAGVAVVWVLIVGVITGIGKLIMITHNGNGNLLGDHAIPHWFAAQRTARLNHWSLIASNLGATQDILIASVAICVIFIAVTRHWRPVIFVAVVMAGEVAAFLVAAAIVKRPRPDVAHLDAHLPTSAFPSGHMAATTCLYVGIAILVIGHARGWWRYLSLIPAIVMPVLIATARMYRGEHHPTDILASVLFAALWLTAATMLIKPSKDGGRTARRQAASPRTRLTLDRTDAAFH